MKITEALELFRTQVSACKTLAEVRAVCVTLQAQHDEEFVFSYKTDLIYVLLRVEHVRRAYECEVELAREDLPA